MPIVNSLAFLFTVLGEWWAEGKVIGRGESIGPVSFSSFFLAYAAACARAALYQGIYVADCWCVCVCGIDTWIGMAFVLGGIALCVHSKN